MKRLVRRMPWSSEIVEELEPLSMREWLVTNGLGGYASGTVSGVVTRRYHGLLIAALPAPLARTLMLAHLSEQLRLPDGRVVRLGKGGSLVGLSPADPDGFLKEFRLDTGLPVWRYEVEDTVVERCVFMAYGQNTVYVNYRLCQGSERVRLKIMPTIHFRSHDAPVSTPLPEKFNLNVCSGCYELSAGPEDHPPLRMFLEGEHVAFTAEPRYVRDTLYRIEERRGYESVGDLWTPGYFRVDLAPGGEATLIGSAESWETVKAMQPREVHDAEIDRRQRLILDSHPAAQEGMGAELVLAADQFIIRPATRTAEAVRRHAAGDEACTVIAGYHWFTDWGRDTMISLDGLTLVTGRHIEAGYILRTFAQYIRDGLIPNLFPEGENVGLYHTADATLWFFHAVHRYVATTGDQSMIEYLLPKLLDIVSHHVRGTHYGIGVDPADGLLRQGAAGYQLTWMDAKMGDWVVTPRRGKAVEINALWYNAVRLLEGWVRQFRGEPEAEELARRGNQIRESFNRRFWYKEGGYLYDVVDGEEGDDGACRPNQIFAISLPHPALDQARWTSVMKVVRNRLLTPVGLRSLAPGHPDYKPKYYGDLRTRDGAYHQGTVWGWLIGPFIDAWLKTYPSDREGARQLLDGFADHLDEFGVGSIAEIFDAEAPFTPRGCIAQAWSVAEVLRCWVNTTQSEPASDELESAAESSSHKG